MENEFIIKGYDGNSIKVKVSIELYTVKDFMGKDKSGLALQLLFLDEDKLWKSFGVISKSFGEFIGIKNAVYIDTNNCPYAEELLEKSIAVKTIFTKSSGFCKYPLWILNTDFLEEYGGDNYKKYSEEYDQYMSSFEKEE